MHERALRNFGCEVSRSNPRVFRMLMFFFDVGMPDEGRAASGLNVYYTDLNVPFCVSRR